MEYGLIGEHLGHSFSKQIHSGLGNDRYILREVPRDRVDEFFETREFSGINVTIPYKKTALAACDEVSDLAKRAQAVNCVVNRGGRLYGENTDCAGILATLEHAGIDVRDKTVLVLGRGGAATAVQEAGGRLRPARTGSPDVSGCSGGDQCHPRWDASGCGEPGTGLVGV